MGRREDIIDAAVAELATQGPSRLRLKRVADAAGVSIGLISTYFGDREGLIAAAVASQYTGLLANATTAFSDAAESSSARESLLAAFDRLIVESQAPERVQARLSRLEALAIALHNDEAGASIQEAQESAGEEIVAVARTLADRGLIADGLTDVAFARIWYALLFGQVIVEHNSRFAIDPDDWVRALRFLAACMVSPEP